MDDADRWRMVGQDISMRRRQRSWSQGRLAQEIGGWAQSVVSDDERGPTKGIPASRLVAYSQVLVDRDHEAPDLLDFWLDIVYHGLVPGQEQRHA